MRPIFRNLLFTLAVILFTLLALGYPEVILSVGDFDTRRLIVPLLMLIMFGMGTTMSIRDFYGVVKMPMGVLIGVFCQFSIMPLVGFFLAKASDFPPEIAAGIILVGCSPSGLASNVMSYIAGANVALSITLTAVATLLSPLFTPVLMKWLAGAYVPIDFWAMVWSICKIVIFPIAAGLLVHRLLGGRMKQLSKIFPLISMAGIVLIIGIITAAGRDALLQIGGWLILAVIAHNLLGYFLGYSLSLLARLDRDSCRTVAFEVGMQNSGLASGIALEMGRVATMGLAPAVFGPWMNISGSGLAAFWKGKKKGPSDDPTR
jgi:BASS family bile acid:Na+ symporter